jgi:hypothetical protein
MDDLMQWKQNLCKTALWLQFLVIVEFHHHSDERGPEVRQSVHGNDCWSMPKSSVVILK